MEKGALWRNKTRELLIGIYDYMAENMSKGTASFNFYDSAPIVKELYEKFVSGEISEGDLRERFKLVKPYLETISRIRNG